MSIRANFYKCGDELQKPHFLSWNPIKIEAGFSSSGFLWTFGIRMKFVINLKDCIQPDKNGKFATI